MHVKGVWALSIGALVSMATATAHLSCLFLGPGCYRAQLAPPEIVQSAVDGTLLAPISTLVVSILFILCSLFALSGAGYIKRLPLLELALVSIASLCVVRGLSTIPISFLLPELATTLSYIAGVIWFFTGLLFGYGYLCYMRVASKLKP